MNNFRLWLLIIILTIVSCNAAALNRGDTLSPEVIKKMALDPNKISVIDFFASWCVSCRIELPAVDKLAVQLATTHSNVEFVGVQVDEDPEVAAQFLKEVNLGFRVVDDMSQQVISEFEPLGMPALYYIHNNKILGVRFGAIEHIDQVILSDLKQLGSH
jgi:cytochrome c biogenesis protein CcmG/thiol:disulfide interchange protein DsbE